MNYKQRQIKKLRKEYPNASNHGLNEIFKIIENNKDREDLLLKDKIIISIFSNKDFEKFLFKL